jgi:hypothetical protein
MSLSIPDYFSKHAISIGNQGRLLKHKGLAGTPEEVEGIFLKAIPTETRGWSKKKIVLYAHGGLVPARGAIKDITPDIKTFLERECYLVAFIWRTGPFETIVNIIQDALRQRLFGLGDSAQEDEPEWLQEEIEGLCGSPPIREMWLEMKENAELASSSDGSIPIILGAIEKLLAQNPEIELHLIGHSAGGIFHAHTINYINSKMQESSNIKFKTCTLWAPACTTRQFNETYVPMFERGSIDRLSLFTLTDNAEQSDTAGPYPKSLLYLVSNAFEGGRGQTVPLIGMSKFVQTDATSTAVFKSPRATWIQTSSETSPECSSHGDFSKNTQILDKTISLILEE